MDYFNLRAMQQRVTNRCKIVVGKVPFKEAANERLLSQLGPPPRSAEVDLRPARRGREVSMALPRLTHLAPAPARAGADAGGCRIGGEEARAADRGDGCEECEAQHKALADHVDHRGLRPATSGRPRSSVVYCDCTPAECNDGEAFM